MALPRFEHRQAQRARMRENRQDQRPTVRQVSRQPYEPYQVPEEYLGGYNQGDTMTQIARNEYLNTLPVGGERERAMNAMGYWNNGVPFVPQVARGTNRYWRQAATGNAETQGYTAPGIYQQMDPQNRGYIGVTNVQDVGGGRAGAGVYTPFDVNARQRTRPNRGGPYNQPGGMGPGGRPAPGTIRPIHGGPGGGRPVAAGGGMGSRLGGGGGHIGPGGRWLGGGGQRPLGRAGGGGGGGGAAGGGGQGGAGFPAPQPPAELAMPLDPQFEAARRQIEDALAQQLAMYGVQQQQIKPMVDLMMARIATDRELAVNQLNDQLIGRGIYRAPLARQEQVDLGTQFDRQQQDVANQAAQSYADIAAAMSGAQTSYQQQLAEALLASAANYQPDMRSSFAGGGYPAVRPQGGLRQTNRQRQQNRRGGGRPRGRR